MLEMTKISTRFLAMLEMTKAQFVTVQRLALYLLVTFIYSYPFVQEVC
jgi:hypothetical protein